MKIQKAYEDITRKGNYIPTPKTSSKKETTKKKQRYMQGYTGRSSGSAIYTPGGAPT